MTPSDIPYQVNWWGLCSRRNPRYTPTLLAVPPPKGLSLRSGEANTWEVEEAPTCITLYQSLPPINDTTNGAYWVPFIPHGIRRLTVLTQHKKRSTLFTAGSHSCLWGGCITPACHKMPPPQSGTVPTSGSRQVRQQANPRTHWSWT